VDDAGNPRTFSEYAEARGELIVRIGEYCSFCESQLNASLAVEHMLPKQHRPDREHDWNNFLLCCVNCNSTKGDKRIRLGSYYWPDRDNTARAFAYTAEGMVNPAPGLTRPQTQRAKRTLRLTGLDKVPAKEEPKASDRRWQHRRDAWGRAVRCRERLAVHDNEAMRKGIVEQATALGFWSIWMAVFARDMDMRRRLIAAFVGTATDCFDSRTQPVPRSGGAL
jgi:uncharacterized protein (TIGR02646 family)